MEEGVFNLHLPLLQGLEVGDGNDVTAVFRVTKFKNKSAACTKASL